MPLPIKALPSPATLTGLCAWNLIPDPAILLLVYTEAQINYTLQGIGTLLKDGLNYLTVKQEVQDDYNERIQKRMTHTVWTSGSCQSWYLNKDGTNHALYPGLATQYTTSIRHFKLDEYILAKKPLTAYALK